MLNLRERILNFTQELYDLDLGPIDLNKSGIVGSDNIDFTKVLQKGRKSFGLVTDVGMNNKIHPSTAEMAFICMETVCQGIGGKTMSEIVIIPKTGEKRIYKPINDKMWRLRNESSGAIGEDDFTKRRCIRIGAMVWDLKKKPKPGYYQAQGHTKNNFCLGYEYVCKSAEEMLKYLAVMYIATKKNTDGTQWKGIAPSILARALKVAKKTLSANKQSVEQISSGEVMRIVRSNTMDEIVLEEFQMKKV